MDDLVFRAIHWDEDEYVVSAKAPGAIGMTLKKPDAWVVANWLNNGGYMAIRGEKAYACSVCGFSPKNHANWCNLGCGSDYNEMIEL